MFLCACMHMCQIKYIRDLSLIYFREAVKTFGGVLIGKSLEMLVLKCSFLGLSSCAKDGEFYFFIQE